MGINWGLYNKRLNINGTTSRDRNLQSLQNTITNKLPDALSYKAVKINNIDTSIEIVKTTKDYIKVIHSLPKESFDCGDYILYNGKTYLITEIDADDDVYTSGQMQLCTYTLKFQSPSGTILSYPCIDESSNTVGIDESDTINTLNGIHKIMIPYDDNTKLILIGRRFFVDKYGTTTCKTTHVNNTSLNYGSKGLIVLTLQEDSAYNPTTDKNGVCNYFEAITEPEPTVVGYSYSVITCSNPNNELTLGGVSYRTLTPTFYESDGTVSTNAITAVWNLILPVGYESAFDIIYVGNQAKIKVAENYDLLGKSVIASIMGSDGGYGGNITLTIIV